MEEDSSDDDAKDDLSVPTPVLECGAQARQVQALQASSTLSDALRVADGRPARPTYQRKRRSKPVVLQDDFDKRCCSRRCWHYFVATDELDRYRKTVEGVLHQRTIVADFALRLHPLMCIGDGHKCCVEALLRVFGLSRNSLYYK